MAALRKLIEIGAKILDKLDQSYVLPIADYTNLNPVCTSCELCSLNEETGYATAQIIERFAVYNKDSIFEGIVGYEEIKREFAKALNASSPVSILLYGPPGCGKSEFLKQIRNQFEEESVFIDGSYCS